MVALSKYYSEIMESNSVTCAHVLHPNTSCTYFLLETLPITLFRTAQFFVPLYFVSVKQQRKIYKKKSQNELNSKPQMFTHRIIAATNDSQFKESN